MNQYKIEYEESKIKKEIVLPINDVGNLIAKYLSEKYRTSYEFYDILKITNGIKTSTKLVILSTIDFKSTNINSVHTSKHVSHGNLFIISKDSNEKFVSFDKLFIKDENSLVGISPSNPDYNDIKNMLNLYIDKRSINININFDEFIQSVFTKEKQLTI